ncbi:MAG TPA: isoprenylcysteine carboxylmethyltransferase family protein [Panacibacter sp.]|nr:isoprenylcysteine carboxylmethyltransferase family protein [Panacibacter sp.]
MNIPQHIWLVICWIIFGALHSVLAGDKIKKAAQALMLANFKFYRLCYSVLAAITLAGILYYHFSISSILLWKVPGTQKIISAVFIIAGISIMLTCVYRYFFSLSGVDVFFKKKTPVGLQTDGLNAYMRHPLYTGTLLFVLGFFLWQPLTSNFISCLCIFLYTITGTLLEEQRLLKLFGDEYKNYTARVPMFIPKFI